MKSKKQSEIIESLTTGSGNSNLTSNERIAVRKLAERTPLTQEDWITVWDLVIESDSPTQMEKVQIHEEIHAYLNWSIENDC